MLINGNCILSGDDEALFYGDHGGSPERELIAQVFIQAVRDYLAGSGRGESGRVKHFQTARKFLMSNNPEWAEWRRSLLEWLDVDEFKGVVSGAGIVPLPRNGFGWKRGAPENRSYATVRLQSVLVTAAERLAYEGGWATWFGDFSGPGGGGLDGHNTAPHAHEGGVGGDLREWREDEKVLVDTGVEGARWFLGFWKHARRLAALLDPPMQLSATVNDRWFYDFVIPEVNVRAPNVVDRAKLVLDVSPSSAYGGHRDHVHVSGV